MKAFHNDPKIKAKYLDRVNYHIKMDHLHRGIGFEKSGDNSIRACAVGCTLEKYEHQAYETELGIPEWLARVEDKLFEGMSKEKAMTWPRDFLRAINPGADLQKAKAPFMIIVLQSVLDDFDHDKFPYVYQAVQSVIDLYELGGATEEDFREAAEAARAAAEAAAEVAVWAAEAAEAAAEAAVWAAGAARYDYFADELLKILKGV